MNNKKTFVSAALGLVASSCAVNAVRKISDRPTGLNPTLMRVAAMGVAFGLLEYADAYIERFVDRKLT